MGRMGGGPCENCVLMEEYRLRGERRGIAEAHLLADIFGNKNLVFLFRKGVRALLCDSMVPYVPSVKRPTCSL